MSGPKERSAAQEQFIDLCRLLGEHTPAEADPTGERYCFERGARKDMRDAEGGVVGPAALASFVFVEVTEVNRESASVFPSIGEAQRRPSDLASKIESALTGRIQREACFRSKKGASRLTED